MSRQELVDFLSKWVHENYPPLSEWPRGSVVHWHFPPEVQAVIDKCYPRGISDRQWARIAQEIVNEVREMEQNQAGPSLT